MPRKGSESWPVGRGVAVRKRGDWYQLRWRLPAPDGTPRERTEPLDTTDLAQAMARAADRYRRYQLGTYDPWTHASANVATCAQAIARFQSERRGAIEAKTLADYVAVFERFCVQRLPGGMATPLTLIRPADLQAHVYDPTLSQASKRSYYVKLGVVLRWATKRGLLQTNPLDDVDRPAQQAKQPKYLRDEDVQRLLAFIEYWHSPESHIAKYYRHRPANERWVYDTVEFIFATGLRRGEAARLTWGDVTMPTAKRPGTISVRTGRIVGGRRTRTKTHRDRLVTMTPRAEAVLARLLETTRRTSDADEPVLKGPDGEAAFNPTYLSKKLRMLFDEAKLNRAGVHGLRHSFAADLLDRGADLITIRDELGHRDLRTTEMYLSLHQDDRARRVLKLYEDR